MGERHGYSDASHPSGTPDGMRADSGELLRAALECETEGPWTAQRLADGTLVEHLSPAVRAAALAAFVDGVLPAELGQTAWLGEEVLTEALEVEASEVEASAADAAPLGSDLRRTALAAEASARLDDLLEETFGIEAASEATAALRSSARAAALVAWDAASATAASATTASTGEADVAPEESAPEGSAPEESLAPVLPFPSTHTGRPMAPQRHPLRSEPLRARRMRAPLLLRPVAAAALLLLALGAGLFLFGDGDEAEAGLQLRALSRRSLGSTMGMSQIEPGYFASLGRVFTPGADELLSFGFAYDGLIVVGAGDAVRVTRPSARADQVPAAATVVLRLESGEARLATHTVPIALEVDGLGLLVLEEGAAHVALHAESPDGAPALALAEHSVARFHRADGTSVPLAGPTRVLLAADGVRSFGTPARSLFRELAFFGGPLPRMTQVRSVSARLFDVRAGSVRRGRQDVRILAATPQAAASAQLAWRPPPVLADAQRVRVALRAPVGTTVTLAQMGRDGPTARVEHAPSGEPGVATVELALEQGWYERLPDGRLELTLEVPAASAGAADESAGNAVATEPAPMKTTSRRKAVRAWFDGISLVLGSTEDGLPSAAGSPASFGTKGVPDAVRGR